MTGRPSARPPRVSPVLVDELASAARAVLHSVVQAGDLDLGRLSSDPVSELDAWSEVEVQMLHDEQTLTATPGHITVAPRCSVAGTYYPAAGDQLPTLAVVRSMSGARDAFTVLHELGHHFQRTDGDLIDALGDLDPVMSVVVEDAVCDHLASSILIPDETVALLLGAGGPTAPEVVELYSRTSASRAAVCVRAAQQLQRPGHVLLLDEEDRIQFSSSRSLFPLRRRSDQSTATVVRRARASVREGGSGRVTDNDTRFAYRAGDFEGESLYAQSAAFDNGYLVIVAVLEKPPWTDTFVMPKAETGAQTRWHTCERPGCGHEFQAWNGPHEVCGVPKCPECGYCGCTAGRVAERYCPGCFQRLPEAMFEDGSERCCNCD